MRITANMVTLTRIVLMPIPGYLLYGGASELMIALSAIVVLGLTDWVDGIMARREGPSVLGGLLDPMADKIFIAVIFIPLTEQGIIPLWMTMCVFVRELLVTSLRTSLSLRDAPMRTSMLAKFKTAVQMTGIGYVILYTAYPNSWFAWALIISPAAISLGLMAFRLVTSRKQGTRSLWLFGLSCVALALRIIAGLQLTIDITLWAITAITVFSGFSYLSDAWGALKGTPGSHKEVAKFALDGVLVPASVLLLLGRFDVMGVSALIICIITLELAVGGLGNLLASNKVVPRFRWIATKSISQFILALAALYVWYANLNPNLGALLIAAIFAVTVLYASLAFYRQRAVYLKAI